MKFLAILIFLVCSKFMFPSEAEPTPLSLLTDKDALISIRSQINSEPPNLLPSWDKQYMSPCNWTGVVCNKYNNRVVGLNLSSLRLVGSISPHIGNLSFLRFLQLQNNQLTGEIPVQISNLFRLRVLNLNTNSFHGSIPLNVSKLSKLRVLDLTMNKLMGRVPGELSLLSELEVLNLGRNLFWGIIPPSLGNLSSLVDLSLGTNTLSGMIPDTLSCLQNLKVLDLAINNLTGNVPPSIYNMSSLVSLSLASNQLWGKIPDDVGDRLPNLLDFRICFNKFTGSIPGSLHNLTNIKVIRMSWNLLGGTVPPGLGNLPFLEMYNIGFNRIVSSGHNGLDFVTSLTNSTHLNLLAIDGNLFHGVIPESVGNLSKALLKLYMGGNQISGNIPATIGHLSGLTLLNLSYNAITGVIPSEVGNLEELQMLGLAENHITGSIPGSFGNLQKLNQIDLSGNKLEGRIPASFGNFRKLLSMDLSNNKLNGSLPKEILSLSSLSTVLNLSNNFLSGHLPPEIGLLNSIITIDLSNNSFSGSIPSTIKNCKSLEKLIMANNMFSGSIPSTLGEVKALETLDLSYNNLSGLIPPNLINSNALRFLNLSFNNLEGLVLCGGKFKNQTTLQLEGNPKLYVHLTCENTHNRARRVAKVWIIIVIMATLASIFTVGSIFYLRKNRGKNISDTSGMVKGEHQSVSYNELRQATGNFGEEKLIGSGSFGSVYKGDLGDGCAVAIKVLDNAMTGSWKSFLAECEALRYSKHRNLVKLITTCSSLDQKNMKFLALVYEFLNNGSLEDWLTRKKKKGSGEGLNVLERLNVAIDVASALDYLHHDCEAPVVHCDLKPSNILLDEDFTAKVGDFGLARMLIQNLGDQPYLSSTHVLKGSIGYIPPEYGVGAKPSTAGDTYSFGVMVLELFTGKSPIHEDFFMGEQNLKGWVQSALPWNVQQVQDPELLLSMENFRYNGQSISSEIHSDCLITVFTVGLSCTANSPDDRISIRDALTRLKFARDKLLNPIRKSRDA